jgi:hypothetical protein
MDDGTADPNTSCCLALAGTVSIGGGRPTSRSSPYKPLFDIGEATERVAAAVAATRKLGFPFMLTARAEGFRYGNTDQGGRSPTGEGVARISHPPKGCVEASRRLGDLCLGGSHFGARFERRLK